MISCPTALAKAISEPTSNPSHKSAKVAVEENLGSTTISLAPAAWLPACGGTLSDALPWHLNPTESADQFEPTPHRNLSPASSKYCRQTDDARSVSSSIAAVYVV